MTHKGYRGLVSNRLRLKTKLIQNNHYFELFRLLPQDFSTEIIWLPQPLLYKQNYKLLEQTYH